MKPNELMTGNYLAEGIVTSISDTCIWNHSEELYLFDELEAIPLTEEWLLKFGFGSNFTSDPQERNASKAHYFGDFKIHQPEENYQKFMFCADDFGIMNILFVHQLQNLYFILMGEELTIKN